MAAAGKWKMNIAKSYSDFIRFVMKIDRMELCLFASHIHLYAKIISYLSVFFIDKIEFKERCRIAFHRVMLWGNNKILIRKRNI